MLDIYQKRLSLTIGDSEAMITVDGCDFPKSSILIHLISPCFRDYGQDYLLYLYYKEFFNEIP